jgi:hypothetical protein
LIVYIIATNATRKLGMPMAIPEMSPTLRSVPPELPVLIGAAEVVEGTEEVEELAALKAKLVDELLW